jgi:hypothetical protein
MQDGDENLAQLAGEVAPQDVRADDGKHCPSCRRDIGMWSVVAAGLPDRIRCPHCQCRLRYENAIGVFVVLAVALAGVLYGAVWIAGLLLPSTTGPRNMLLAGVVVAAWIPVEVAAVRFLRARRKLVTAR